MLERNEILSMILNADTEEDAAETIHRALQEWLDGDREEAYWRDQLEG